MKKQALYHPKTTQLMHVLGVPRCVAGGILNSLWILAGEYAPRGDIGRMPDEWIAHAIDWRDDPAALIAALTECHWLDPHPEVRLILHDWSDHCEDSIHCKLARATEYFFSVTGPVRPKLYRFTEANRPVIQRQYDLLESGQTELPLAAPNGRPKPAPRPAVVRSTRWTKSEKIAAFNEWFALYPSKLKAKPAQAAYFRVVKSAAQAAQLLAALQSQLAAGNFSADPKYIPAAVKYLADERWTDPVVTRNAADQRGAAESYTPREPDDDLVRAAEGLADADS